MTWRKANLLWEVLIMAALASGGVGATGKSLWFDYEAGSVPDVAGVRTYGVELAPIAGKVFVYATFEMIAQNPIPYVADQPQGRQLITVGQAAEGGFVPAVRFGIHDGRSLPKDQGVMYTYLSDGQLEYYGMWMRPNTPHDFKLRLDLASQRLTAWCCRRGDDEWYLLAENAPLMNPLTEIDRLRVEQCPGAAGVSSLMVRSVPWAPREKVQPHLSAKPDRVVGPGRGFKFQSMRSTWGLAGRHVTVARKQGLHFGFPDVARADGNSLVCVFRNGSHTGGQGGHSLCTSHDLGQTWGGGRRSALGARVSRGCRTVRFC